MPSDTRRTSWFLCKPRHIVAAVAAVAVSVAAPAVASAHPKGAYVTDLNGTQIDQFTIGTNLTLSFNGSASSDSGPAYVAVTPNGKYLYSTVDGLGGDGDGTTVDQYRINSEGSLTPLSPASVPTGFGPVQVAVSPDGKNAYVASYAAATVTEYSIASNGSLHSIGTLSSGYMFPEGVAVSRNGSSVYVVDAEASVIFEYNRASGGTLTPKSPATVAYSAGYVPDPGFTPNGKYLYVSGGDGKIDEYKVGSGGDLSPLPVPSIAVTGSQGLVVSPNSRNVYSSDCTPNDVRQFRVGSGGELGPMTPASVSTDGCGVPWMTASGRSLYAPDGLKSVYQFKVSSSGALTPKSPARVTHEGAGSLYAIVIPPDQGPVAKFTVRRGRVGKATRFNASRSSDSDGKVASYHWSFGDGHRLTTTKARVKHVYKHPGKHKVSLAVTDDSGCSLTLVFTGQTAFCHGTPAARVSHKVKTRP